MVANPASGPAVGIASVIDRRAFERRPRIPSIPSLKDGQVDNRVIISRAIARRRMKYGKAVGDILSPEGRTIDQFTREAVTQGLRESGFRVLGNGDSGDTDVAPLGPVIYQFWTWVTPGFWSLHIEFDSRTHLVDPLAAFRSLEDR